MNCCERGLVQSYFVARGLVQPHRVVRGDWCSPILLRGDWCSPIVLREGTGAVPSFCERGLVQSHSVS
jgi:hypothetical protein